MKLIDKDVLLTEIERRMKKLTHSMSKFYYASNYNNWKSVTNEYKRLISFIDTIEVKEVDLENIAAAEWDDYIRRIDGEPNNAYMLIERNEYINLAKHFFEIGLLQKG